MSRARIDVGRLFHEELDPGKRVVGLGRAVQRELPGVVPLLKGLRAQREEQLRRVRPGPFRFLFGHGSSLRKPPDVNGSGDSRRRRRVRRPSPSQGARRRWPWPSGAREGAHLLLFLIRAWVDAGCPRPTQELDHQVIRVAGCCNASLQRKDRIPSCAILSGKEHSLVTKQRADPVEVHGPRRPDHVDELFKSVPHVTNGSEKVRLVRQQEQGKYPHLSAPRT